MEGKMRPYQETAYRESMAFFASGGKSALVVLPTGLGKTILIAAIAGKVASNGGKILLLAHRTSLVSQMAKEVSSWTGEEVGIFHGKKDIPSERIVASTVQSMANGLARWSENHFALVCVDETHHIPASTYQKITSYFGVSKLLGVTATPKRGDRTDVSKLFEKVVSEYTLASAIRDGWLSPIKVKTCRVFVDVKNVEETSGDYSVSGIGGALAPVLKEVALAIKEEAGERKTIVFVPLVSTAVGMAEIFNRIGMKADWVAGERKDSEKVMEDYHDGKFQVLVNSMLLTEGYNEPSISCLVNLRLTKAVSLYTQMIGRGTRKFPGKEDLLVLDFMWQDKTGRHHLNAKSAVAIASGEIAEEDIPYFAEACVEEADYFSRDVLEGIESAKERARQVREKKLAEALTREEEKNRGMSEFVGGIAHNHDIFEKVFRSTRENREPEDATKKYSVWRVKDPVSGQEFKLLQSRDKGLVAIGCEYYSAPLTNDWAFQKISQSQADALSKMCVPLEAIANRGHASFVLDILYKRAGLGLCSYKQAAFFSRYDFVDTLRLSRRKAAMGLDMLKKNGWRPGAEFRKAFGSLSEVTGGCVRGAHPLYTPPCAPHDNCKQLSSQSIRDSFSKEPSYLAENNENIEIG